MRALVFLGTRRVRNSLKSASRNPRVLLPLVFIGVILALVALASFGARGRGVPGTAPPFTPQELVTGGPGALVAAIRSVLLVSVFTSVVTALGQGAVFFQPADVDFLFPSPLSRRGVLFFQMLGRYARMLLPSVYLPLAFGGATLTAMVGVSPLRLWPGMLGMWLFFVASANFAQAALLARAASPAKDEPNPARRFAPVWRLFTVAAAALAFGLVGLALHANPASVGASLSVGQSLHTVLSIINSRAFSLGTLPVAWTSDLLLVAFAGWNGAAVGKFAGTLMLTGVSFFALFSRERDFYEGALETTERRNRLTAAVQGGDAGAVLTQMARDGKLSPGSAIPAFGFGAWAVLWKDMIALTRTPPRSWLTLLFIAAFPAALGIAVGARRGELAVLLWLMLFTLNMANLFLLSVRDMVRRVDITKALPIAASRLLLGELGLSIVQLTCLGILSLSLMALAGVARGRLFGAALLILPTLAALMLFVQTIFVLVYPPRRDDVAQSAAAGVISLGACVVALSPSLLIGMILYGTHAAPMTLGLFVTLANGAAAFLALRIAARLWERFDPTS